ncbi:unnamed protein product [Parascedosporium putredinis]|uniref:Uncharacterized protein n=1 Tax=Parascedosporium putredinis TaxID=1442378 RepID=A0A9P1MB44_9PEZI|nr:unnamed protein product [Parascedosporium putredinis]CAI7997997.1 unnamed protein product [Parascedosporium putredinis]
MSSGRKHGKTRSHMAFENASTNVAAAQMRNALTGLAETVKDPHQKKLFETEMDNFFSLFRRYLNDKAQGNAVDWDRINPLRRTRWLNTKTSTTPMLSSS